jgi:hypothetical protein
LLVACFARNDGEAASLAAGLSVPALFRFGVLFPMPEVPLLFFGEQRVELDDILPVNHNSSALQQILTYGASLPQFSFRLAAILVLSPVYLALSAIVFHLLRIPVRADFTTIGVPQG